MSKIKKQIEQSKTFEKILSVQNERSKKIAWSIAGLSVVLASLSLVAVSFVLPLKETELTIVTVDNTTGRAEVLTKVKNQEITEKEAVAKYFISQYIKLREGYNYPSLQRDYENVQLFSNSAVTTEYLELFNSNNAPDVIYNKNSYFVSNEIISNIITPATDPEFLSTVRFKKTVKDLKNGSVKEHYYSGRITFRFDVVSGTSEEVELNPLGFKVTSYEVEREIRQ